MNTIAVRPVNISSPLGGPRGRVSPSGPEGVRTAGRHPGPGHLEPGLPTVGPGGGTDLPDDLPAAGPLRVPPDRAAALLIVGAKDHVVPLGQYGEPEDAARLGDFVQLSAQAAHDIPRCERVVVPECGHIPHLETPDQFLAQFLPFLAS